MDGGSLKMAACVGMLVVSLVDCGALMCSGVGSALFLVLNKLWLLMVASAM
jgi:hypothetical protein